MCFFHSAKDGLYVPCCHLLYSLNSPAAFLQVSKFLSPGPSSQFQMSFRLVSVPRSMFSAARRVIKASPPPPHPSAGPGSRAVPCYAPARPLGGSVSERFRAWRRLGAGLLVCHLPHKQGCVSRHGEVRPAGRGTQKMEYLTTRARGLHASRARSGPQADLCRHFDKGAPSLKAVWEVSFERTTVTLCPPRFKFSTDHRPSGLLHP